MKIILAVAPHPDDETLGCAGTLLRYKKEGATIHWLIMTSMLKEHGFLQERIESRQNEIEMISKNYPFDSVCQAQLPTTKLDSIPFEQIVEKVSRVFSEVKPTNILVPYPGDVHTDHRIVFDAVISCSKWFRYPFLRKILAYETLSETDFNLNPDLRGFKPNVFVDISDYLDKKIELLKIYKTELGIFPFPRSEKALRALAALRGTMCGSEAAESFMLLKEILT